MKDEITITVEEKHLELILAKLTIMLNYHPQYRDNDLEVAMKIVFKKMQFAEKYSVVK